MTRIRIFSHIALLFSLLLFFQFCHTSPEPKTNYSKNCSDKAAVNIIFELGELRKKQGLFDLTSRRRAEPCRSSSCETSFGPRPIASQTGPGGGPLSRLRRQGVYRDLVGENIARVEHTQKPGEAVLIYWLNRRVEARNLMNSRYLRIGVNLQATKKYCYCVLIMSN